MTRAYRFFGRTAALSLVVAAHGLAYAADPASLARRADAARRMATVQAAYANYDAVADLVKQPHVAAPLLKNVVAFHGAKRRSANERLVIAQHASYDIAAGHDGLWAVPRDGKPPTRPTPEQLGHAGLGSVAKFNQAIDEHAVKLANGDAALSAAEAHDAIQKALDRYAAAEQLLHTKLSPAAQELVRHLTQFRQTKAGGALLAKRAGTTLEYVGNELKIVEDGMPRAPMGIDLVELGLESPEALDQRIEHELHATAGTTPAASTTEQALDVLRARADEATQVLHSSSRGTHPDLELLKAHHVAVTMRRSATPNDYLHLAGKPDQDALEVRHGYQFMARNGTKLVVATLSDLARHEMTTRAALNDAVGRRMLAIAGLAGNPTGALLSAARDALQSEITEANALHAAINGASTVAGTEIALYRRARARGTQGTAHPELLPIPLATHGTDKLEIRPVEIFPGGRRLSPGAITDTITVVDAAHPHGRLASLADLHRFGIDTRADLVGALSEAFLDIPDADLPVL